MKGCLRVLSRWVVISYSWLQNTGDEIILTEELNFKITTHVKMGMKSNATRGQAPVLGLQQHLAVRTSQVWRVQGTSPHA